MSDHEVTLVNDSMQEFFVRFHGPDESECDILMQRRKVAMLACLRSCLDQQEKLERGVCSAIACLVMYDLGPGDTLCSHHACPHLAAPFAGGVWKIHVELQDQYPYKSPSIGASVRTSPSSTAWHAHTFTLTLALLLATRQAS